MAPDPAPLNLDVRLTEEVQPFGEPIAAGSIPRAINARELDDHWFACSGKCN